MITKTSCDAVGERAYRESCAAEMTAFELIEDLDQYLSRVAPWAHRIDDLSDVCDTIETREESDEESTWRSWTASVRVRAPRGTFEDGQRLRFGSYPGVDVYAYKAVDVADHYLLSVHSR